VPAQWRRVLADGQLLRLNYGIFALHAALLALFVQVPFMLRDDGLDPHRHWVVYLPVLVASAILMWPALIQADRPGRGVGRNARGRRIGEQDEAGPAAGCEKRRGRFCPGYDAVGLQVLDDEPSLVIGRMGAERGEHDPE